MEELKKNFPDGVDYSVVYDPTVFVRHSIEAVVHTLLEAILLVVIVVIVFLQTWRASIIPLVAVPVSLIGTFAVMLAWVFPSTICPCSAWCWPSASWWTTPSWWSKTSSATSRWACRPVDAAKRAMSEVTSPIIATALVLCAVFVPTAFHQRSDRPVLQAIRHHHRHLDGDFGVQFADAFPGPVRRAAQGSQRAQGLVRPVHGKIARLVFPPVQPGVFAWAGGKYSAGVGSVLRKSVVALVVYGGLVALTGWSFNKVPTGFVPTQDKQYLVAFAQLPDAASLDRTEAVIRRMSDIGLKQPGVEAAVAFPGLSISGFSVSPNEGIVFFCLKPFEERNSPSSAVRPSPPR
jgi:multidrug efflux pump